ncbi:MAG: type II toxin-antitoxin system VapC family toxin [Deltaproteobacteria bacterium]|nr:type II toxin-antitoxin system VapC family toxin [Deltaproteobacteria bacterium]
MISVDTNIIIRLLTKDDKPQYKKTFSLFKKENIFIPTTVVLETEWVLRYAYNFTSSNIINAFRSLFGLPNVELEDTIEIARALEWNEQGMDFADALHLAKSKGTDKFITFDKKLISKAKALADIPTGKP